MLCQLSSPSSVVYVRPNSWWCSAHVHALLRILDFITCKAFKQGEEEERDAVANDFSSVVGFFVKHQRHVLSMMIGL